MPRSPKLAAANIVRCESDDKYFFRFERMCTEPVKHRVPGVLRVLSSACPEPLEILF